MLASEERQMPSPYSNLKIINYLFLCCNPFSQDRRKQAGSKRLKQLKIFSYQSII